MCIFIGDAPFNCISLLSFNYVLLMVFCKKHLSSLRDFEHWLFVFYPHVVPTERIQFSSSKISSQQSPSSLSSRRGVGVRSFANFSAKVLRRGGAEGVNTHPSHTFLPLLIAPNTSLLPHSSYFHTAQLSATKHFPHQHSSDALYRK